MLWKDKSLPQFTMGKKTGIYYKNIFNGSILNSYCFTSVLKLYVPFNKN